MNPILSILIPVTIEREVEYNRLYNRLVKIGLNNPMVEEITDWTDKAMTLGEKRQWLYQKATGKFSWQIDSDDDIHDDSISLILDAIKKNPDVDCITFEEYCLMDGKEYKSNHSLQYHDWEGDGQRILSDGFHFHRTPFYKDVIRTSIAKSVPFEYIRFGEDHSWSRSLKPHLKTEIHIPEQIYRYIHNSSDFNERYGFDR